MKAITTMFCIILMLITAGNVLAAKKAAPGDQNQISSLDSAVVQKIDINNADETILTKLPGIGPKTATRINEYRKVNGPFKSVDDILNIKGIGPKVLEKIKPYATVS